MDMKICKQVSKIQNSGLKVSTRGMPKSAKIVSEGVLSNHWTDCYGIWGYDS